MKRRIRWWRGIFRVIGSAYESRAKSEIFIYMGVPSEEARSLDLEELIDRCGQTAAIILGRMTLEEAEERHKERTEP